MLRYLNDDELAKLTQDFALNYIQLFNIVGTDSMVITFYDAFAPDAIANDKYVFLVDTTITAEAWDNRISMELKEAIRNQLVNIRFQKTIDTDGTRLLCKIIKVNKPTFHEIAEELCHSQSGILKTEELQP